jgi:hypothetical protein
VLNTTTPKCLDVNPLWVDRGRAAAYSRLRLVDTDRFDLEYRVRDIATQSEVVVARQPAGKLDSALGSTVSPDGSELLVVVRTRSKGRQATNAVYAYPVRGGQGRLIGVAPGEGERSCFVMVAGVRRQTSGYEIILRQLAFWDHHEQFTLLSMDSRGHMGSDRLVLPQDNHVVIFRGSELLGVLDNSRHVLVVYGLNTSFSKVRELELPADIKYLSWSPDPGLLAGWGGSYLWLVDLRGPGPSFSRLGTGENLGSVAWLGDQALLVAYGKSIFQYDIHGRRIREIWSYPGPPSLAKWILLLAAVGLIGAITFVLGRAAFRIGRRGGIRGHTT